MGLVQSALYRLRLRVLRLNEMESSALRQWFRRDFDVDVGLYSYGCFDRWRFPGPVVIGRYCSFATSVLVVETNHPIDAITSHPVAYDPALGAVPNQLPPVPPLLIGDGVWIGHAVTILPKCRSIGRGAIIGAGSVVTKNVEPYTIVAGNPAKMIRDRFNEATVERIEAIRWWELSIKELGTLAAENPELFFTPGA